MLYFWNLGRCLCHCVSERGDVSMLYTMFHVANKIFVSTHRPPPGPGVDVQARKRPSKNLKRRNLGPMSSKYLVPVPWTDAKARIQWHCQSGEILFCMRTWVVYNAGLGTRRLRLGFRKVRPVGTWFQILLLIADVRVQSVPQPFFQGFIKYEKQTFQSCALPNINLKTFIHYREYSQLFATCTDQVVIQSAGQVKTAEILSTLMMGYALADTLALHKGEIPRNTVLQPNRLVKSKWPASKLLLSGFYSP